MDLKLFNKVNKLNKVSLIFGVLSVAMPLLLISMPLISRIIQIEETHFSFLIQVMQISGITFGIIGYFISRHSLNLVKHEKADDELIPKIQASRTWNIIGIVLFLVIFCGSLNMGIAY